MWVIFLNFFEHLDKEFAKSKEAFLYTIKRLPESKIIVVNVGLSSLMYDTGLFNIRNLRNFIADIAELINSDSKKRVVIVVSDSIRNTRQQYFALQGMKRGRKDFSDLKNSKDHESMMETLTADSRVYSALVSVVHSDIVNLFYDGFLNYNLKTIGFSISSNGADVAGELKRVLKSIENIAFKPIDDNTKVNAIKDIIHSSRNVTQTKGFKVVTQKTSDTIKGLFKAYPRTIPIIMEELPENSMSDEDSFAAKIACAINADVMVSVSRKGMLYTVDPLENGKALPFYCYDTSRTAPFSESRKKDLAQKLNAAKAVNCHSRPIPMLLTSYNFPYTVSNMFSSEKTDDICVRGELPYFTTFINTSKILRFSSDISIPIENRHIAGTIVVDRRAAQALRNTSSLLSVGILAVNGNFEKKTTVAIADENGTEIGKGVTDFSSKELLQALETHSSVTVINRAKMRIY